ncbi:MAG: hypothetical protein K8R36_15750 [Planctomycetales bacterium]|nr:hypothetical protein [Planctomycetales bacterium]
MPDFLLMAKSLLLAAIVAGAVLLVIARTSANPATWRLAAGRIGGLLTGIYVGCGLLGEWPRWPPLEDRDRFLTILLPSALVVEAAAMLMPSRRWLLWSLRIVLAAATAPILLHNSIYLADLVGPGSAEWSRGQAVMIIGLSVALLCIVWGLLALLQSRTSAGAMSPVFVLVTLATAVTVMLSGYYRGGLLALPIAGAIAGVSLASCAFSTQLAESPCLGIGILGTFAVIFIGRFYGSLPTSLAICLFVSPLLAWTAEIPRIRNLPGAARTAVRVTAVLAALFVVVACAQVRFSASVGTKSDARP